MAIACAFTSRLATTGSPTSCAAWPSVPPTSASSFGIFFGRLARIKIAPLGAKVDFPSAEFSEDVFHGAAQLRPCILFLDRSPVLRPTFFSLLSHNYEPRQSYCFTQTVTPSRNGISTG